MTNSQESPLAFPCWFPIKAMGRNREDFETLVTDIVLRHAEIFPGYPVTTNASGAGNFLSVTVTIEATSREQLDRIYQDLTECERVLMAL
jgi:putative lipoic acid-binding regulatory protein